MSHTHLIYHLIFRTKNSEPTITMEHDRMLYAYLFGVIKSLKGFTYRIGGTPNHIHILCTIPANIAVSDFVRDLKRSSSLYLLSDKMRPYFPLFSGWAAKYAAFSRSAWDTDQQVAYIRHQKEHHRWISFEEEFETFLQDDGLEVEEDFLFVD